MLWNEKNASFLVFLFHLITRRKKIKVRLKHAKQVITQGEKMNGDKNARRACHPPPLLHSVSFIVSSVVFIEMCRGALSLSRGCLNNTTMRQHSTTLTTPRHYCRILFVSSRVARQEHPLTARHPRSYVVPSVWNNKKEGSRQATEEKIPAMK